MMLRKLSKLGWALFFFALANRSAGVSSCSIRRFLQAYSQLLDQLN